MKVLRVNYKNINKVKRLDGSYHLSEGVLYLNKLRKMPNDSLENLASKIFTAGRNKRVYTDKKFGFPYLSNTDISNFNPFESCKYNSKKYAYDELSFLKEGMIVTGRVGAIGQTSYVTAGTEKKNAMGSDNIIRIVPTKKQNAGYIYAFFASKYGNTLLWQLATGGVQPYISEEMLKDIPIPKMSESDEQEINGLIIEANELRDNANKLLETTKIKLLSEYLKIGELDTGDYEHFGNHSHSRKTCVFYRNINEISSNSINAFNYSKKVENIENQVKKNNWKPLIECLDKKGFFSTGSFKRLELDSKNSVKLINQSDIFNLNKKGKFLARKFIKNQSLTEYGEVLIAGVGTLGENETFCRVVFSNEELQNQLISGEFIRMKTNSEVPSGYLFLWLNTDYGFRFIRKTQSGTKLCRPIPKLLETLIVPIIDEDLMIDIDIKVKEAHTWLFNASVKEKSAIERIEKIIDLWQ
jgi:type I restriction enzyme S subunit